MIHPALIRSRFTLAGFAAITLIAAACAQTPSAAATPKEKNPAATPAAKPLPLAWHDVTTWGVEGRAFGELERKRWFDRFPASADGQVTPAVWNLSRDSAGLMVRFKTDSSYIWADYTLLRERINGVNMTPIGASGLDLYARDDAGKWRWVGVARPEKKEVRVELANTLKPGLREYAVYLPLYNGIEKLSIGVAPSATFEPLAPRTDKPMVFYGTSITQGASASRPGMVHTAILGRRFERSVINLGFSGNGRMDTAVGELLIKIDASVYVIDCLPNMGAAAVREKCIPLVNQLRAARPSTPIVLVEDRRYTNSWIQPKRDQDHSDNHAALREAYEKLKAAGVTGLYYIGGDDLLGADSEGATDGSHPNDLGFVRQADVMEPILRAALAGH
ncbi:MAG: SGNH/GDSL hydrolase family protein [Opitutaceae bacterium]